MTTCTIARPPTAGITASQSGQFEVEYDLDLSANATTWSEVQYDALTALELGQTLGTPHPIPQMWAPYDLRAVDPIRYSLAYDLGSYLTDIGMVPVPATYGNKWIVSTRYRRLNDGEIPGIYGDDHPIAQAVPSLLGTVIKNPLHRYPIFNIRRFVLSTTMDGGFPAESLQGADKYAPVSGRGEGVALPAPWQDYKPIDDNARTQMIATANKLPSMSYARTNIEMSLFTIRFNIEAPSVFVYYDRAMRNTVWNGGDDWQANGGASPNRGGGDGEGNDLLFTGCYEGQVRYQGGGIIGDRRNDYGAKYWECEYRFELAWNDWSTGPQFDRQERLPFVASVQNASNIKLDGSRHRVMLLPDDNNVNQPVSQPQYLTLDGTRDDDQLQPSQPFLHWWYSRPYDYFKVGNGVFNIKQFASSGVLGPEVPPLPSPEPLP